MPVVPTHLTVLVPWSFTASFFLQRIDAVIGTPGGLSTSVEMNF